MTAPSYEEAVEEVRQRLVLPRLPNPIYFDPTEWRGDMVCTVLAAIDSVTPPELAPRRHVATPQGRTPP